NFDIAKEPDEKYRNLLRNQIRICNKMKADILDHAQKTYFGVINGNEFLVKISCNFKKLEKASKKYNPNYNRKRND
ncbi:MAG: type III toxin-antitoxin system ToxN/AbiQ family toxin, partial [Clostridia bacterium]|nr:type III toxin-antitoxin system ToxN/AbiQ family toxin [Clostridia bacterium]